MADSIPLDEHMAVVDGLTAAEARITLLQQENDIFRKKNEESQRMLADTQARLDESERMRKNLEDLRKILEQKDCDAKKHRGAADTLHLRAQLREDGVQRHAGRRRRDRKAFMYSIYESCVMNEISFNVYIEEVLNRIQDGDSDYRSMLPNSIILTSGAQEVA